MNLRNAAADLQRTGTSGSDTHGREGTSADHGTDSRPVLDRQVVPPVRRINVDDEPLPAINSMHHTVVLPAQSLTSESMVNKKRRIIKQHEL